MLRLVARGLAILCLAFVVVYGAWLLVVRPAETFGEPIGKMLALMMMGALAAIGAGASWFGWPDSTRLGFAVQCALGAVASGLAGLFAAVMIGGLVDNPSQSWENYVLAGAGVLVACAAVALVVHAFRERKANRPASVQPRPSAP